MVIKQTRIQSSSYFSSATVGKPIRIKVENVAKFPAQLKAFGFRETDESGTIILPSICNRYAARNAEPYFTVNKTLPKEEYTQTVFWTRHEWAGRDETREVTELAFISRKRYHRDYFAPFSVNFMYVAEDEPYIISEDITYIPENTDKLLNTVNMVLAAFGECVLDFEEVPREIRHQRLNWDILPPGEYPWPRAKETLEKITKRYTKTQRVLMLRNCEAIYNANPDFVAYGRSGFKGYAVFGFSKKNIYVLESVFPNNATYVLGEDWETISKLSKAEILSQNLHKSRIVHSKNWEAEFKNMLEGI